MSEKLIEDYRLELQEVECVPGLPVWSAKVRIEDDVSEVMPYLNAVLERAFYSGDKKYIIWKDSERKYALRPHELALSSIFDREQAQPLVEENVAWINEVWENRGEITPDHEKRVPPQPLEVLKHLPQTNCGDCGCKTCMAFVAELLEGNLRLKDCPRLLEEENAEALRILEEMGV